MHVCVHVFVFVGKDHTTWYDLLKVILIFLNFAAMTIVLLWNDKSQ